MARDKELERRERWLRVARRVYNWTLWGFVVVLQLAQVLGGVPSIQSSHELHATYGQSPLLGLSSIPGANDDPFTDRSFVCSRTGRLYKPQQLSTAIAIAAANSLQVSASSSSVNGYRVLPRQGLEVPSHVYAFYVNTCNQIAATVDNLYKICTTLGYNVSAKHLRVVVGQDDDATLVSMPFELPVLILPYWDNARNARFAIPSEDGSACVFRLEGKYVDAASPVSVMRGVNRSVRAAKTMEWLNLHGGTWRHGWYEHGSPVRSRWYSDVISTGGSDALGILNRHFDTVSGSETDCSNARDCSEGPVQEWWGTDLYVVDQSHWYQSVTVSDGKRRGLFIYSSAYTRYVSSIYRLDIFISNLSMTYLLFRWLVALIALHSTGETVGVGVLACARSFQLLPLILLPRLKTILAAVFGVGCYFEGDQKSLSEAFFVVYPSISEFVMLLFSVVSLLAKILRRRVSDALFGPTLLLLCLIYYTRYEIAEAGWFGIPGRVTSVVSSTTFEAAHLSDFFTTDLAYRMDGKITLLFAFKMALVAVQLVVLTVSYTSTSVRTQSQRVATVETAMAIRVALNGGMGQSSIHLIHQPNGPTTDAERLQPSSTQTVELTHRPSTKSLGPKRRSTKPKPVQLTVVPYEVVRTGFLVLGDDVLLSIHDWCWFVLSAPFRLCGIPMDHMLVMAWTLDREDSVGREGSCKLKGDRPTMFRVTDDRFNGIGAWDIKSCGLR